MNSLKYPTPPASQSEPSELSVRASSHTPGPWEVDDEAQIIGNNIVVALTRLNMGWQTADANAARIVACVNACEGMDDPAEAILQLREEIAARVQIGADGLTDRERELAEALRWCLDNGGFHYTRRIKNQNEAWCDGVDNARAALARVRP